MIEYLIIFIFSKIIYFYVFQDYKINVSYKSFVFLSKIWNLLHKKRIITSTKDKIFQQFNYFADYPWLNLAG